MTCTFLRSPPGLPHHPCWLCTHHTCTPIPITHAYPLHSYSHPLPPLPALEVFAVLTNTHLVPFGKNDTICVQQLSYVSMCIVTFLVSPQPCQHHHTGKTWDATHGEECAISTRWSVSVCVSPTSEGKSKLLASSVRGEEMESCEEAVPILFVFLALRICWIDTVSHTDVPEEDDEDMWVNKDNDEEEGEGEDGGDEDREMTVMDDREGEGDEELPAPGRDLPRTMVKIRARKFDDWNGMSNEILMQTKHGPCYKSPNTKLDVGHHLRACTCKQNAAKEKKQKKA
ncbi:hypothetical protein B0H14DRAFT_2605772 [Mycena olivaceomarginata]|nr:hypothetical protein B0H14DRAFT_2605772 [Mycena olivaceomarginata]